MKKSCVKNIKRVIEAQCQAQGIPMTKRILRQAKRAYNANPAIRKKVHVL